MSDPYLQYAECELKEIAFGGACLYHFPEVTAPLITDLVRKATLRYLCTEQERYGHCHCCASRLVEYDVYIPTICNETDDQQHLHLRWRVW